MYKELVIRNVVIIALSLAVFFCLSMIVINFVNRRNLETQLEHISVILGNAVLETNSDAEIREVINDYTDNQQWLTVVIANSLGDIIIDSSEDTLPDGMVRKLSASDMEKLGLPGQAGVVYMNSGRIFYIVRLNDDIVFRTSLELGDKTNFILLGMFILTTVLVVVLAVSIWLIGRTSSRVIQAFDNVESHLKSITKGQYQEIDERHRYEEVSRAYRQINAVNNNIVQYITRIKNERDKLNYVIENINEGILIIGLSGKVYSANECACKIFGIEGEVENAYYKDFISNEKFLRQISKEIATKSEIRFDYTDERTGNVYLVSLNYFRHSANINDEDLVSVVLYDVTALRKEERIKADFIANASHELKTPITSISGFSELLLSGLVTSPDDVAQYASNIHSESVRMKHTVDELLYLSKLDYSDEIKNKTETDLAALTEECFKNYRKAAKESGVKLVRKGESAVIMGDSSLLSHMLGNLVDNAIKYNKKNGTVTVETGRTDEGKIFLKVSDTGRGIQPQHLNKLFDRFYRVDNSRNRDTGGTGLGLTIVQKICALHNAAVQVESQYEKGTVFTVVFEKEDENA